MSFKQLENAAKGSSTSLSEAEQWLQFNTDGLIPAIAQQHDTGEVLMMAWMNRDALEETLRTQKVCYWSRSRQKLWRKGEQSGNQQQLIHLRIDCDGDTLLLLVDQKGPACHTGRHNCFFHQADQDQLHIISDPEIDPKELYGK